MSQKAFDAHIDGAKKGSTVIIDPDLVNHEGTTDDYSIVPVKAMSIADGLGQRMVSNMVMLGALVKMSGVFPIEALEKAVGDMLPVKAQALNLQAVHAGSDQV
jgi:2-oxoglutarate ferredoxin oxidoreductase subunit gamma